MKRFKYIFRAFLAVLLINLTSLANAQDFQGNRPQENSERNYMSSPESQAWLDSVDISLLTCGPGQEVWSYYGHTALRIEDHVHGTDPVSYTHLRATAQTLQSTGECSPLSRPFSFFGLCSA